MVILAFMTLGEAGRSTEFAISLIHEELDKCCYDVVMKQC